MRFDLKGPCPNCPFRSDKRGYLRPARVEEICVGLFDERTFSCHKTVAYSEDDEGPDDEGEDGLHRVLSPGEQMCGGARVFLRKQGRVIQLEQISGRLIPGPVTEPDMSAPVFDTTRQMVQAQEQPQ